MSVIGVHAYLARDPIQWLCESARWKADALDSTARCDPASLAADSWTLDGHKVSYCLVQDIEEKCLLQLSSFSLGMVLLCNLIKLVTMSIMSWKTKDPPLVVLGDCIASFLEHPDANTAKMCLLDRSTKSKACMRKPAVPRYWDSRRHYWFSAASPIRWMLSNAL